MASIFDADKYTVVRFDKDDWLKGLLPHYSSNGTGTRIGDGLSYASAVDPLRDPGYLLPGFRPATVTNSNATDSLLKNGVVNGQTAYIVGGTKLHSMNATTNTVANSSPWPHTIAAHGGHSGVGAEDVILYRLTTTKYLFYSWNNSADGDIGRFDLSSTFDDDYASTAATGGAVLNKDYPHPMVVGDDGVLYIANGNVLAALDGRTDSAGAFEAAALDLPTEYVITSFAKAPSRLVIYAQRQNGSSALYRGEATAFFWDYVSSSFDLAIDLPGAGVNGGFVYNGIPGCFVEGHMGSTLSHQSKLVLYDGARFREIVSFNNSIPGHGGVDVSTNAIRWYTEGFVFRWGSPYQGIADQALNVIANISAAQDTASKSMLRNFFFGSLIVSNNINGGLLDISTNFAAAAFAYTGLKQLPPHLRDRYQIAFVRVNYRAKVTSGRGFYLAINADNNPTTAETRGTLFILQDSASSVSTIGKLSRVFEKDANGKTFPKVSTSLGLFCQWGRRIP